MTRRAEVVAAGLLMIVAAAWVIQVLLVRSQDAVASESASLATRWRPLNQGLPTYALAVTVAVQPTDPAIIYAGTYEPPGLWRSDDGGRSWTTGDEGLNGSPIYTLHWDGERNRWWVGARDGLYTRSDADAAWQTAGLGEHAVYALAEDEKGRLYVATENGLFCSDDATSWEVIPISGGQTGMAILSLDVTPDGRMVMAGTGGQGLWISRNGGTAWSPAADPRTETGKALAQMYVPAVLLDTRPPGPGFASTSERAYWSTDGGATWQAVSGLQGRVHALIAGADGTLYAALIGQIARSADGGHSWTLHSAGLPPGERILDLAVAPDNPALVYAAAWDDLYVSTDRGDHWAHSGDNLGYPDVNALAWDGSGNLLAATRAGLYRQAPDRTAWEDVLDLHDRTVLTVDVAGDGRTLYAGCFGELFRSTDGGVTWSAVASELTDVGIAGLVVDPADFEHLLAWMAFGRVHESWDGGQTWIARWEGLGNVRPVTAIHRSSSGRLFVGTEDGLFRWEPATQSWQPLSLPSIAPTIFTVETNTRDAGIIYAGATDGLWRSSDDGQTWHHWGNGLEGKTVTALALSPTADRIAFAGTRHLGLYLTLDGGVTWLAVWKDRLATASVRDVLFSNDGTTVYVASDQGLWQGEINVTR